MQPIVDRLEQTYLERADFRSINAGIGEGKAAFQSYALPGHPGYVILSPEGDVIWKGFGPQSAESLEGILDAGLTAGSP